MADGKTTKAELAEAVRELREEVARLRAERSAHVCAGHGLCGSHAHCNWGHCFCWTYHYSYPLPGCAGGALPLVYTTTVWSAGNISAAPWATSNAAAGCSTTYGISN